LLTIIQEGIAVASVKTIDEIDVKVLKFLLKNSRKSFSEIAKECNVSTVTIKNRYNELKKAGIIKGSTVILDLANMGIECDASLEINVSYQQLTQFIKDTRSMPGIHCGPVNFVENYNAIAWSPAKSITEIEKIKASLKQHSAVIDIRATIWTYMKVIPENLSLNTSDNR
jgi:DNA-binding Lrp family transcriptional regulator